jgi:hypothetical protein
MEWVPASIAIRTGGRSVKHCSTPVGVARNRFSVDHHAFFVERAVMTPDIAKIDPNISMKNDWKRIFAWEN